MTTPTSKGRFLPVLLVAVIALAATVLVLVVILVRKDLGHDQADPGPPPDGDSTDGFEVKTFPAGAEIFYDWRHVGVAPSRVVFEEPGRFLVVRKEGYESKARRVDRPRSYLLELKEQSPPPAGTFLLLGDRERSEFLGLLVEAFRTEGLAPLPPEDALLFDEQVRRAVAAGNDDIAQGGMLEAWVRSWLGTAAVVQVLLPGESGPFALDPWLGDVREQYDSRKKPLELDVLFVETGGDLVRLTFDAAAFESGSLRTRQRAWEQVAKESGRQLRETLLTPPTNGTRRAVQ